MARAARHLEEAGISEGAVRRGAAVAEHRRHRGEARAVLGGGGRRVAQRGEAALEELAVAGNPGISPAWAMFRKQTRQRVKAR